MAVIVCRVATNTVPPTVMVTPRVLGLHIALLADLISLVRVLLMWRFIGCFV